LSIHASLPTGPRKTDAILSKDRLRNLRREGKFAWL
jgi:hypothetical protein